jgi:hypothetical protein
LTSTPRDALLELASGRLTPRDFEHFCLELVRQLPGVVDAHTYGVPGDAQDGIDLHTDLDDGRVRAIQCRRVQKFGKPQADKLLKDTTYPADEYWLWCTCELTKAGRDVMDAAAGWTAWGLDGISATVRDLDRERARWLVEDYLGASARKRFLGPEADLAVMRADRWFTFQDETGLGLPTGQALRGRDEQLGDAVAALDDPDSHAVIVSGRAGIGKTRFLRAIADAHRERRVLWLRDGIDVLSTLADELPHARYVLMIDDAHRRDQVPAILATAMARTPLPTVVLATRPHRGPDIRADLYAAGIKSDAIASVSLDTLSPEAALALAKDSLDDEHQATAPGLATLTRDLPALCVIGARLINADDLTLAELAQEGGSLDDIVARFKDELLGAISAQTDRALVTSTMDELAAFQPLALASAQALFSERLGLDAAAVRGALDALDDAGLLAGVRRRRLAPDILGDHVLRRSCVRRDGTPTGRALALYESTPPELLSNVLENLAELDWRLGDASVLDDVKCRMQDELRTAGAWDREQLLKSLNDSASYLAPWIVELARDLLDHPANDQELFGDHVADDASARHALAPLLGSAALDPDQTEAAVMLLWELARDLPERSPLFGADPMTTITSLGSYGMNPVYVDAYLRCAVRLMAADDADEHRLLPVDLLRPLTVRGGQSASLKDRHAISLNPFMVDAAKAEPVRRQVREALEHACVDGGPRTRAAAAARIEDMLRQPFGLYGRKVADDEITQWRHEQLELLAAVERIMSASDDELVRRRLRDALAWHAECSRIRGVKTRARAIRKIRTDELEEVLARAVTHGFSNDRFPRLPQTRRAAARLIAGTGTVSTFLDCVDDAIARSLSCEPERRRDVGPLLAVAVEDDPAWGREAARVLAAEPGRPSAQALGAVLRALLEREPGAARAVLSDIAVSRDPQLRRLAADYVARAAWIDDPSAPERQIVLVLAADDDVSVREYAGTTAIHIAEIDPDLARLILIALEGLDAPSVAECVFKGLESRRIVLSDAEEDELLRKLVETPRFEYWHARYVQSVFRRRPLVALKYLLARIGNEAPFPYDALPLDGFGDLLSDHDALRLTLLVRLLEALEPDDRTDKGIAQLFWSLAGLGNVGPTQLTNAIVTGTPDEREVALRLLSASEPGTVLERPAWVAQLLDKAPAHARDDVRQALTYAAEPTSRSSVGGRPAKEDLEVLEAARKHRSASAPGSRSAQFWSTMISRTGASIDRWRSDYDDD